MDVVVIGGTGHIGSFLVPRLVRAGHRVTSISRGRAHPYVDAPAWDHVRQVAADREAEDREGTFASLVAEIGADAVVDLVCYTPESAQALVEALRGRTGQLVHCGSIWRHGPSRSLPISEDRGTGTATIGEYGIAKAQIAQLLAAETDAGGLTTSVIHPGHIVGPGWMPIGPLGNLDPGPWRTLSAGEALAVPGDGTQMMHHVHADDVAQLFELAIAQPDAAAGQEFHAVAPSALSVRGYAEIAAGWFGQEAHLNPVSWEDFRAGLEPSFAEQSVDHLMRNHVMSIAKGISRLGYAPRYEPEEAILESIRVLIDDGRLEVAHPLQV